MGFCLFNNVAVAARHALAHGARRVAIVDFDVHHGNGTQWSFYGDPRVLVVSTHQYPFYPGTGAVGEAGVGDGEGFTVNLPLAAGATDGDYLLASTEIVCPIVRDFAPDLLLVSAGFDAHVLDPLARMQVTTRGFGAVAGHIRRLGEAAGGRLVLVLEGGYHLAALEDSVQATIDTLAKPGGKRNSERSQRQPHSIKSAQPTRSARSIRRRQRWIRQPGIIGTGRTIR